MNWREQWLYKGSDSPGIVTYIVNYCDVTRFDIKYTDKTKNAQYMLTSAIQSKKVASGKYQQVVAYYNLATKTYSLYFLGIDFMYSNPEISANQHKYFPKDLKPIDKYPEWPGNILEIKIMRLSNPIVN